MKKGMILSALLVLIAISASYAQMKANSVLNAPEDYEGKTLVFDEAWIDEKIVRNPHFGFYCLDVDIQNKHVPGYLYRSQLNFVIFSDRFAKQVMKDLERAHEAEKRGPDFELLDHVCLRRASPVRLTCIIERFQGYWIADVKKVELYGKQREIVDTIDSDMSTH